jgi:hypothetical protein
MSNTTNIKILKYWYLLVVFVALVLIGSILGQKAFAQSVDLGIYPPVFQIQATAPSDVEIPFSIQNFMDSSIPLTISLKPFTADPAENGNITFLDTANSPDPFLQQRIQVLDGDNSIGNLTLSPQQKKDLTLEVQVPGNEPKGDYYLSLVFSSSAENLNNKNSSQATLGIASNILLSIGPVGKTSGYIEGFSTPFFVAKGPIPFTLRVKNASDHYITPKGSIVIKNMFGQTIGKVNLLSVNILANTIRRIPDATQSDPSSKNYQAIKTEIGKNSFPVAIWPEKFLVGPYTAMLTLALSDSGPLFTRTIMFFAFPLEYLIAILLIVGLIIFIAVRVNQSRKNL